MKKAIRFIWMICAMLCMSQFVKAQISGTVFRDYNGNGVKDNSATFNEPFVSGITVLATLPNGTNFSTTTNTSGAFSFTAIQIPSTTQVRIEFSGLEAGDYPALRGSGNATNVQFVTAPSAIVSFAISYPKWYSGVTNPWVATNRLTAGLASATGANQSGTFPNLVVLRHATSGDQTAITTTAANQYTGSVFGLTYQKETRRVFMAAFMKRLYSFGPGGVGGIYTSTVNQTTGVPSNPSVFVDLSTIGITVGADPHAGLPNTPATASNDAASWPLVGKRGIGGIDLSDDGKNLWVVNMNPNGASTLPTLHRIFINNPAVVPTAGNVTTWNIPTPTLTGATTNFRPMAIKLWKGRIFVGGVCIKEITANQSTADTAGMRGVVYEFNETSGTFTIALSFPLTYKRPYIDNNENQRFRTHYWGPWQNSTTSTIILNDALSGNSTNGFPYGSQPMLSNIEFDVNGDMLIGLRDRWGDQMGWNNYLPTGTTLYNAIASAEILRAGNCSASTWTIESNAAVCSGLSSGGNNLPGLTGYTPNANNVGPGGGLYYFDTKPPTFNHQFRSTGGLAVFAGSNTLTHTAIDPDNIFNTGGIMHIYNSTLSGNNAGTYRGGNGGGARLYNDVAGTSGKSGGMGDCELLTDAEPIQIGNRIWLDTNGDGVQDANETTAGVATGSTVTLRSPGLDGIYGNADDQTWTTTTDAAGNYFFSTLSSADNRKPAAWTGIGNTLLPGYDYRIEVSTPTGVQVTKSEAAANTLDNIDNDAVANGTNAFVSFNTSNTNYNFDIGFKTLASIGDRVWLDNGVGGGTNNNGIQDGTEPGVAGITVTLYQNGTDGLPGTADDVVIGTTVTDAYGNYLFDNLTPSTTTATSYNVGFTLPANYQFTTQTNTQVTGTSDATNTTTTTGGSTSANGSDANINTGRTGSFWLAAGEAERGADAGIIFNTPAVTASVGDRVWYDTNGNGTQDAGEPGVSGVTVTLYNNAGVAVATTITDANGNYLFTNVTPATGYTVGFTPPAGTAFTTSTGVVSLTTNSDANTATGRTGGFNVAAGEQVTYVDAGLVLQSSALAALGDLVWYDNNRDGDQDAGEPGIAGVTVNLYLDADGNGVLLGAELTTPVRTTTTDAFGNYIFNGLTPGSYGVVFVTPSGLTITTKDATGGTAPLDATDSDADQATGRTILYGLPAGAKNLSVDCGMYSTAPAANVGALGNFVWNDLDGDGVQDAGEPGVAGITVILYNNAGTPVDTVTTDATGGYLFTNLTPGNYTVGFSNLPAGFSFTGQDRGGNDATDSDVNPATGRTASATVTAGATNTTVDAGIRQGVPSGLGSLGNRVWYDLNNNGLQDAGELGVAGVTVTLLDAGADGIVGNGDDGASRTTLTNALGEYLFGGLPAGNYMVQFGTAAQPLPTGFTAATQNAGTNDNIDSDGGAIATGGAPAGSSRTAVYNLAQGEDNLSVDLGIVPPINTNTVSGQAWFDNAAGGGTAADGIRNGTEVNGGVAGVTVTLYNGAGIAVGTTTTDANGNFSFVGVPNGTGYTVGFSNYPPGMNPSPRTADGATNSDADRVSGRTGSFNLTGGTNIINMDAGIFSTRAALGNYVWSDLNNDGVQTAGEPGVSGVTVSLYFDADNNGTITGAEATNPVATAITDANGAYFFPNLVPGNYQVGFTTVPNNMLFTRQNTPGDNGNNTNSDATPATGLTGIIALAAGEIDNTIDAGLTVPQPATIGNRVWADLDKNGLQDAGEPGISGVLVTLYNSGDVAIGSAITDGNGNWQITNVPAGTGYYLIFTPNLPSFNTTATPGSNPAWAQQNIGANGTAVLSSGTESDVDSDVNPTGANAGRTGTFDIVAGNNFPNMDAGIINWPFSSLLPIKLESFTAAPQGSNVLLKWTVSEEINVDRYEIEFSTNGTNFASICSTAGAGLRNYQLLHTSPIIGINYYRLKSIDKDGQFTYSEVRKVNFGKGNTLSVYPNPVKDNLSITVTGDMVNKPATISIIAMDGKLMRQQRINAMNQTESINTNALGSGKYIVRIVTDAEVINRAIEVIR